jgi:hypothetical protein
MNIKEAKQHVKNTMKAYFYRDEYGRLAIPVDKQRPIFLVGAPGIGKTAIMEQIAGELGVALVSYSMTHHTRQSALGLPFIVRKNYGGAQYDVSEYTMSEIIASVYEKMEETGLKEGILFLDEINCVSETLTPSMLQFLQFKVFGRHRVPDGWIVVTAGNPPEYNKSVREFDIVTLDRLKQINVEPDFDAWKEYAWQKNVHPAVLTYLEIKKDDFYIVETGPEGRRFVTARGWDDLSEMIKLCEKLGLPVDEKLIEQYIRRPKVVKDFSAYYDLFNKYRADYRVEEILAGEASAEIKERAHAARFDERLALLGLLLESLTSGMRDVAGTEEALMALAALLKEARAEMSGESLALVIEKKCREQRETLEKGKKSSLPEGRLLCLNRLIALLEEDRRALSPDEPGVQAFDKLRKNLEQRIDGLKAQTEKTKAQAANLFAFFEEVFSPQEMLILVTELTVNTWSAAFISRYGCDKYFEHNRDLLFYERQKEIDTALAGIDLEGI